MAERDCAVENGMLSLDSCFTDRQELDIACFTGGFSNSAYAPYTSMYCSRPCAGRPWWHDGYRRIGQIASTRPDVMPAPVMAELSRLQDGMARCGSS